MRKWEQRNFTQNVVPGDNKQVPLSPQESPMHVYMYTLLIVFGGVIFLYKLLCANSNPRKEARVREREREYSSAKVPTQFQGGNN